MKFKKTLKWIGGIVLTVLLEQLFSLIPFEKWLTSEKWDWIIQDRFNLIDLVIFIVLLTLVFVIFTAIEAKKGDRRKAKIEKHLEKINSIENENAGIKVTWDMYMGSMYDNDPHPYNIRLFCTKHEIPLLMQHGCCTDLSCPNAHVQYNEHVIKNKIESMLLNEQGKLMKK